MNKHDAIDPERLADTLHELSAVRTRTLAAVLTNLQAECRTLIATVEGEREILSILRHRSAVSDQAEERAVDIGMLVFSVERLEAIIHDLEALAG